jgi:hypothetical protein
MLVWEPGFVVSGRRGGLSRSIAAFGEREAGDEHSLGGARIRRYVPDADLRYRQLVTPCACHSHLPEADRSPRTHPADGWRSGRKNVRSSAATCSGSSWAMK